MAKKFFYVCAGVLMLALSFALGANSARASFGNSVVGYSVQADGTKHYVLTADGEVFVRYCQSGGDSPLGAPAHSLGYYWDGGPTSSARTSWGALKVNGR